MDVYTLSHRRYVLKELVYERAKGKEGSVYSIEGVPDLVAKIYNEDTLSRDNKNRELEDKLNWMLKKKINEKQDVFLIAWPKEILYQLGKNGKMSFVGYTMRKVSATYNIHDISSHDPDNIDEMPNEIEGIITWQESMQAAYNLSCLVRYLHDKGVEIGDFNERNFLFDDETGGFALIDCGAYGLFDEKTKTPIFRNKYSMPGYIAPEKLLGIEVPDPRYTDYFYLAIHIFFLLTKHTSPFGYKDQIKKSSQESVPATDIRCEQILNGECIYVKDIPGKEFRKYAVKPGIFPDEILGAFSRTFNYTKDTVELSIKRRTTAEEWCKVLRPYIVDESKIKHCWKKEHVYSAHLSECPWCNPESVSTWSYEKRIKEQQVWDQAGIKSGKPIRNQKSEEKNFKPSLKADSEYKTIAGLAAEVRAEAETIIKTLDEPKHRNYAPDEDYEVVHIGEPRNIDETKLRSAIARLHIHDFIIHKTYGEGEVIENFDAIIMKVIFGNDIKILNKDLLAHRCMLKINSYTDQEYNISYTKNKKN